jgi:hypothetical protein
VDLIEELFAWLGGGDILRELLKDGVVYLYGKSKGVFRVVNIVEAVVYGRGGICLQCGVFTQFSGGGWRWDALAFDGGGVIWG